MRYINIKLFIIIFEKYFTSERCIRLKYFQHEKRNFEFPSNHEILFSLDTILTIHNDVFEDFQPWMMCFIIFKQIKGGVGAVS